MNKKNLFTLIPKVDELLENRIIKELLSYIPRKLVMDSIREEVDKLRNIIKEDNSNEEDILIVINDLVENIKYKVNKKNTLKLRKLI